jgi:hypothetical protein
MNATNLPPEAAIDSAATEVRRAMVMLDNGIAGADDSGLCKCTMHHAHMALKNALADLLAAGA